MPRRRLASRAAILAVVGVLLATVHSAMLANGVLVASVYGNGLVGLAAWDASGCGAAACAPVWTLPSGVSDHPVISNGALYSLVKTGFGQALRRLTPAA